MLNERQAYLLHCMLLNYSGEENKTNKYDIYVLSPFYKSVAKDKFNASGAARTMTDDRKAINKYSSHYIVADKGGWFIKTKYEQRQVVTDRIESLKTSLKLSYIELANFTLDGQENAYHYGCYHISYIYYSDMRVYGCNHYDSY